MVKRGDLPKSLLDCQVPVCAACEYGKATKRPWRTRAPLNKKVIPPITGPGAVVGVDQLISLIYSGFHWTDVPCSHPEAVHCV